MLSSEASVIMVSSGANVIIWCYHVMLSSGMITPSLSGANVIIWCYHVMLSSGKITHPFLFFLKTLLTLKKQKQNQPLLTQQICFFENHSPALQRTSTKNSKQIFPEKELRGHSPNVHFHVSVSDWYVGNYFFVLVGAKEFIWKMLSNDLTQAKQIRVNVPMFSNLAYWWDCTVYDFIFRSTFR